MIFLLAVGGAIALTVTGIAPWASAARTAGQQAISRLPGAAPTLEPGLCDPRHPTFIYGFAALRLRLGDKMGTPLECEHAVSGTGDTRQVTTTGYAYYRTFPNEPAFTNGHDHWALTQQGLVYWAGDVVDAPGTAVPYSSSP
jgi:hypothetical protein